MESSYGVGVANRFAIPDEEDVEVDDPLDIIHSAEKKATEQKKEVKKPVAKGKAPEKSQGKANDKQKGQSKGSDKQSQTRGERGDSRGERKPREGGERRPRRDNNRDNNFGNGDSQVGTESSFGGDASSFGGPRDTRERGRGRGRGRGGPRPPRDGGRDGARDGRREFDRRSGSDKTGVRSHEKREGGGARNWGNPVTGFATADESAPAPENGEETTAPAPVEGAEPAEGEEKPAEEGEATTPAPEDEDAKLMTLDEYKKLQQQSRYKADLNVRKAGENEDLSKWKNTKRYERPAVTTDEDGVEYVIEKKDQRSHSRQTVDLTFQFTADQSSRGGSAPGGRRGGRGGRGGGDRGDRAGGRGSDRGDRPERSERPPRQSFDAPRRNDRNPGSYVLRDEDFPSL